MAGVDPPGGAQRSDGARLGAGGGGDCPAGVAHRLHDDDRTERSRGSAHALRVGAQQRSAQQRSAQHRSAQHRSAQHRSAQHRSAQYRSAGHRSAGHRRDRQGAAWPRWPADRCRVNAEDGSASGQAGRAARGSIRCRRQRRCGGRSPVQRLRLPGDPPAGSSAGRAGVSWGVPAGSGTSANVIATPTGLDPRRPFRIVGAHLDTVPQAPGAEDNASGVAVLLEVARLAARRRRPRSPFRFTTTQAVAATDRAPLAGRDGVARPGRGRHYSAGLHRWQRLATRARRPAGRRPPDGHQRDRVHGQRQQRPLVVRAGGCRRRPNRWHAPARSTTRQPTGRVCRSRPSSAGSRR